MGDLAGVLSHWTPGFGSLLARTTLGRRPWCGGLVRLELCRSRNRGSLVPRSHDTRATSFRFPLMKWTSCLPMRRRTRVFSGPTWWHGRPSPPLQDEPGLIHSKCIPNHRVSCSSALFSNVTMLASRLWSAVAGHWPDCVTTREAGRSVGRGGGVNLLGSDLANLHTVSKFLHRT